MRFADYLRAYPSEAADRLVVAYQTMPAAMSYDSLVFVTLMEKWRKVRDVILNTRNFIQALVAVHLLWLAERLSEPGNAFLLDAAQYHFFLARGGEQAWMTVFGLAGLSGLAGLWGRTRWSRVTGAFAMGTVEKVIAYGLTSSGAAPTAGPTYGTFVILCSWLILAQWMPKPDEN